MCQYVIPGLHNRKFCQGKTVKNMGLELKKFPFGAPRMHYLLLPSWGRGQKSTTNWKSPVHIRFLAQIALSKII